VNEHFEKELLRLMEEMGELISEKEALRVELSESTHVLEEMGRLLSENERLCAEADEKVKEEGVAHQQAMAKVEALEVETARWKQQYHQLELEATDKASQLEARCEGVVDELQHELAETRLRLREMEEAHGALCVEVVTKVERAWHEVQRVRGCVEVEVRAVRDRCAVELQEMDEKLQEREEEMLQYRHQVEYRNRRLAQLGLEKLTLQTLLNHKSKEALVMAVSSWGLATKAESLNEKFLSSTKHFSEERVRLTLEKALLEDRLRCAEQEADAVKEDLQQMTDDLHVDRGALKRMIQSRGSTPARGEPAPPTLEKDEF